MIAMLSVAPTVAAQQQAPIPIELPPPNQPNAAAEDLPEDFRSGLADAAVRLPLAALLGTVLALRPRRTPAPRRDPAVVETQIILAIVGALIMLVIGASLARAFGIAGAANLIRYRAKIEDPKDAVVMLSALSVGLASGVGLLGIASAGTVFLVLVLWTIEGFQNRARVRTFLLTVKLGDKTADQRPRVERLLRGAKASFELRSTSDEELAYVVTAPVSVRTERLSAALEALIPQGKPEIEWKEDTKVRPVVEATQP